MDWHKIRPLGGDRAKGFEELCVQLARHIAPPADQARFIRKGTPDAGVECYWSLPDGRIWAFQAKYFTEVPGTVQWREIDESVDRAIERHPGLYRYTICLPQDRADPRVEGKNYFMDEWRKHEERWRAGAAELGMEVEFDYWGQSEIADQLALDEHAGRRWYWFEEDLFTIDWFRRRVDRAIADAGPRYSREFSIEVPVAAQIDALGHGQLFTEACVNASTRLAASVERLESALSIAAFEHAAVKHSVEKARLVASLLTWPPGLDDPFPSQALAEALDQATDDTYDQMRGLQRAGHADVPADEWKENQDRLRYLMEAVHDALIEIHRVIADNPGAGSLPLLMLGDAGVGKTHLFCDAAKRALQLDQPALVLLGQHFTKSELWPQIASQLDLPNRSGDEILGALAAAAEACGARALLLIDALNEGAGADLWRSRLRGFFKDVSRHSEVALGISVRTNYVELLLPADFTDREAVVVEHRGFAGNEYEASTEFFRFYGIEAPKTPLLVPEFSNPLFLKLLCRSLQRSHQTSIPEGLNGLTAVFDFFVGSLNEELSHRLDYDSHDDLVGRSLNALAQRMAEQTRQWLPRQDARDLVEAALPGRRFSESLFMNLISEGLLAADATPHEGGWVDGIRFGYQRFGDLAIARFLLDRHLNADQAGASFETEPLASLFTDPQTCLEHQGLIDALAIQGPERTGIDLLRAVPRAAPYSAMLNAFVDSLVWRSADSISPETKEYVTRLATDPRFCDRLFDQLLYLATRPHHPLNAEYLHEFLSALSMPQRDAVWSTSLHRNHRRGAAVDRFIDRPLLAAIQQMDEPGAARLLGLTLAWLLTTPNRFVRDYATKALAALLVRLPELAGRLLDDFASIDDVYVHERLLAAINGALLCLGPRRETRATAQLVYERLFATTGEPIHVLARDYAREIVENGVRSGADEEIRHRSQPPYSSEWHVAPPPSRQELRERYEAEAGDRDAPGMWFSVLGRGDFARYIMGEDNGRTDFLDRPLSDADIPSPGDVVKGWEESLDDRQRELYRTFRLNRHTTGQQDNAILYGNQIDTADAARVASEAREQLEASLDNRQLEIFMRDVLNYLDDPHGGRVPVDTALRWVFQRILDLGWSGSRFLEFDSAVGGVFRDGRSPHKAERIGKKYQWIAWHELLARLTDNRLFSPSLLDVAVAYKGPWQLRVRDIDPSLLMLDGSASASWWDPPNYDAWRFEIALEQWVGIDDMPSPQSQLILTDASGRHWLALNRLVTWRGEEKPGGDIDTPWREVWSRAQAVLVERTVVDEVMDWSSTHPAQLDPDIAVVDLHGLFLGEYGWTQAFREMYGEDEFWRAELRSFVDTKNPEAGERRWPVRLLTASYTWEGNDYDCSLDDTVRLYLPAPLLINLMHLSWEGMASDYVNFATPGW